MLFFGSPNASNAVIFLHGFTQSAQNAKSLFSKSINLTFLEKKNMVVFFPERVWFDYLSENGFEYNVDCVLASRKYIHSLIDEKMQKHDTVKLIGYSQGACMALDAFMTHNLELEVFAISGFLLSRVVMGEMGFRYQKRKHKIFLTHGSKDTIIPLDMHMRSFSDVKTRLVILKDTDHWDFWENIEFKQTLFCFLKKQSHFTM
jgi:predicted esterase